MPSGQRIPQEHQDAMVEAYQAGATLEAAAARFGYTLESCRNALKRRGLPTRRTTYVRDIPEEERQRMANLYVDGKTVVEVAEAVGLSDWVCWKVLNQMGVVRDASAAHRKYTLNESFFDVIDTEEKAYWLGFFTADGGIHKNCVSINLARRDHDHLRSFLDALGSDAPVYDYTSRIDEQEYPASKASFSSPKIVSSLAALGVGPRKSLTVSPWSGPLALMRHYWRGYLDGNGHLAYRPSKTGTGTYRIDLTANEKMVTGFRDFINAQLDIDADIQPNGKIRLVRYTKGEEASAVVRLLYGGATVALARKLTVAEAMMAANRLSKRHVAGENENLSLLAEGAQAAPVNISYHEWPEKIAA